MKKTQFVKFSLTLVSAAVLAACSSGGSKTVAPKPEQEAPKPAAPKTPVEEYGLQIESFGNQFVKKNMSDLVVDKKGIEAANNKSSEASLDMTLALHPSLDTIVVAQRKEGKEIIYLEDFDFRDAETTLVENGVHTLNNIHLDTNGKTLVATNSAARTGFNAQTQSETKTEKMGTQKGRALVLNGDEVNYVTRSLKDKTANAANASVAEVYGDRTFLEGTQGSVPDQSNPLATNKNVPNAPLLGANDEPGTLKHVQYGRVTSRLNGVEDANGDVSTSLRPGVAHYDVRTFIGSFGKFGEEGSEDQYFYRSAAKGRPEVDVKALKDANVQGTKEAENKSVLHYRGHAVTYGLDHTTYHPGAKKGIPNAVGTKGNYVVSGTHVDATINLDTYLVDGKIYDKWNVNGKTERNNLVLFQGALNVANGGIKGNSELWYDRSNKGTFKGNLFISTDAAELNATELGGAVKSYAQTDKDWGAVFGLKQYFKPGKELTGTGGDKKSGIVFATDENGSVISQ